MDFREIIDNFWARLDESQLIPGAMASMDARFDFLKMIGESNHSGVVVKAKDRSSHEHVAVRVFRPREHACTPASAIALQRDLLPTMHLEHPNIVKTREVLQLGGNAYAIVMDLVADGIKLSTLLDQGQSFSYAETLKVLHALASALEYAHSLKMHNTRLSLGQILMTLDGAPQITDWGLIASRPDVMPSTRCLHPRWFACAGDQADIYSLGIVGFVIATRQWPRSGEKELSISLGERAEPFPGISTLRPEFPPSFDRFVANCCALRPGLGFATMIEYSLIAGLISLVCVFAIGYVGEQSKLVFQSAGDQISQATDSNPRPPPPPPPPP